MGEHGQGTVHPFTETRKDGTTRTRWRVAVTMSGGKRVWRTGTSPKDAERIRRELVEARELDRDPTRQTVAGYLRSWIGSQRSAKRRRIRERTLIGYERLIEQRIIPDLGDVSLARLSKRKVQAWVDQQPGSAQTVRNAHAVLRKALGAATGDVIGSNPAVGVELPERREYHGAPLTAAEVKRLLEASEGTRLHALWRLAIVTGLREGELLGLSRGSLEVLDGLDDLRPGSAGRAAADPPGAARAPEVVPGMRRDGRPDRAVTGYLTVDHQLQRINGRWVLGPTKAARSLGRIALDPVTVAVVQKHLRDRAAERKPSFRYFGLMFVTERGEPYHQSTVLAEFRRACEAAGIPPRRIHDLRHTNNRLLKDIGIDKETRKARMGHSTDAMTERYGGASERLDVDAVERLAEAIG